MFRYSFVFCCSLRNHFARNSYEQLESLKCSRGRAERCSSAFCQHNSRGRDSQFYFSVTSSNRLPFRFDSRRTSRLNEETLKLPQRVRRSAVLLSYPYAMRYGRVGPVLPIGLLNHNSFFFLSLSRVTVTKFRYSPTEAVCSSWTTI